MTMNIKRLLLTLGFMTPFSVSATLNTTHIYTKQSNPFETMTLKSLDISSFTAV
ncbi:MAG: hypothetical protein ABW068_09840 [Candidatus Thiodiazotropha sp.]